MNHWFRQSICSQDLLSEIVNSCASFLLVLVKRFTPSVCQNKARIRYFTLLYYRFTITVLPNLNIRSNNNKSVRAQAREKFGVSKQRYLVEKLLVHINENGFNKFLLFYLYEDSIVYATYSEVSFYLSSIFSYEFKWVSAFPLNRLISEDLPCSVHILE